MGNLNNGRIGYYFSGVFSGGAKRQLCYQIPFTFNAKMGFKFTDWCSNSLLYLTCGAALPVLSSSLRIFIWEI